MSCLAASETQQEGVGASVDLGEAGRSFLSALVDPDSDRGLSFFGQTAIANRVMLNEPCLGYIREDERQSETARQFMIRQFLEDFSQQELAWPQFRSEIALMLGQRVTNDPKLHLGLDLHSGTIVCANLTHDDVGDSTALPRLLDQLDAPVTGFLAGRRL